MTVAPDLEQLELVEKQMGSSRTPIDKDDLDEFISKTDEITKLIDDLRAGKISPAELDGLEAKRQDTTARTAAAKAEKKAAEEAAAKKARPPKLEDLDEDKREALKAKVDDIMARRQRRLEARERFETYRSAKQAGSASTDYSAWDMWTPTDDEDDMIASLAPAGGGFAVMEKDIEARHARMREARQVAERRRVEGNAAFQSGQYSAALSCYLVGLETDKRNLALHTNAAMAALKLSCFVQAIEHCDKALHLAEFLNQNMTDPLVSKAYLRRGLAHAGLGHHVEAIADLMKAVALVPGDKVSHMSTLM